MVFSHLLRGFNKLHDTRPCHISSQPHIWPARIAMGISGAGGRWRLDLFAAPQCWCPGRWLRSGSSGVLWCPIEWSKNLVFPTKYTELLFYTDIQVKHKIVIFCMDNWFFRPLIVASYIVDRLRFHEGIPKERQCFQLH